MVIFGPIQIDPKISTQLTNRGLVYFRPERDLPIYVFGCVLTAILIVVFETIFQYRLPRSQNNILKQLFRVQTSQLLAVTALTTAQLVWLFYIREKFILKDIPIPHFYLLSIALPILTTFAFAMNSVAMKISRLAPSSLVEWITNQTVLLKPPRLLFSWGFDIIIPILLILIILIPSASHLAGQIFLREEFHHWDFFAMGPTLAFLHGKALGTDTYVQYGVGWPLIINALSSFIPITYSNLIHWGSIYACLYFIGIYGFLRLIIGNPRWAATGVFLTLLLQLFNGIDAGEVMWRWPSSTILRSPMDIWFFIALFLHLKTSSRIWSLTTGALLGFSIIFETDTGIYLTLVFIAYWVLSIGIQKKGLSSHLFEATSALLTGAFVMLCVLAIASRGTLFHEEFWNGWTESLRSYGAGVSLLPIAIVPDSTLLFFAFILVIYFLVMGFAFLKLFLRQTEPITVMLGCIGSYGLMTMILFVGRSHPSNIFHVAVPFGIVLTTLVSQLHGQMVKHGSDQQKRSTRVFWNSISRSTPWCAMTAVIISFFLNPSFRIYPGSMQSFFNRTTSTDLSLLQTPTDVCDLPKEAANYVKLFNATTDIIRKSATQGKDVAVFDDTDTIFYLASDTKPWGRYSPCFTEITRSNELAALKTAIKEHGPEIALIRPNELHSRAFNSEDVWREIHATIELLYILEIDNGFFQIWRRYKK